MVEFSNHPAGHPCWVDLMSPDVDAATAFYQSVFGWDAEDQFAPDGTRVYTLFSLGGKTVAGLGGQMPEMAGMPAVWNSYVATDDVAATVAKVPEAGGTVVMPPMQVMEAGEMAIFTDPAGAFISVWKAGEHIGAELGNEPNTYSWNELLSRDVDASLAFYTAVFGWSYEAMDMGPMGTYNVIAGGENGGLGGIMAMPAEMPEQVPSHWAVYFMVDDLGASTDAVTAGGGQVVQPPTEIPGIGTMAMVHDPHGGSFALLQPLPAEE